MKREIDRIMLFSLCFLSEEHGLRGRKLYAAALMWDVLLVKMFVEKTLQIIISWKSKLREFVAFFFCKKNCQHFCLLSFCGNFTQLSC